MQETVSVVIPTRDRPYLVARAVQSALAQTYEPIEVIVVIDGPDEATTKALLQIKDPRLRALTLPATVWPAAARNAGVNEAQGVWIAFLDDDDEWFPRKLEVQIEAASRSHYAFPIVTSRFIHCKPGRESLQPTRLIAPLEPLSEYLFTRPTPFAVGRIATPTLLVQKELLHKVPFRSDLRVWEDLDWLLRVHTLEGVGIEFVPEPLAIVYQAVERPITIRRAGWNWRRTLAWIRETRHLLTPRAYAGFLLTILAPVAARQAGWKAFWPLLQEAVRFGRPRVIDFLMYGEVWLVPERVKGWLRDLFNR